ncbi:MAG: DNA-protecting protein DprA [Ruminococcaceae bacterium]|nr:DNA-protecting protein DprA [Oscillospiraceae bacterium]
MSLVHWIWFAEKRLSHRTEKALLDWRNDPANVFYAQGDEFEKLGIAGEELAKLLDKDLRGAENIIGRCAEKNIGIITIQDAAYPQRLKNIADPPCVLYVKGHLPSVDTEPVIAVVGTRKCSLYGEKITRDISYEMAAKGAVICTGLAEGIDSRAAEAALMAEGRVIGVLGTAIDEVFPRFNGRLFEDVAARGAIISEYAPGFPGNKLAFPRRNRIIAGLSLAVVVPEAPFRSGALITVRHALDNGRDVFAVPSNADSREGMGSNTLIQEGAGLVMSGWDVLREYKELFPDKISEKGPEKISPKRYIPETKPQPSEEAKPLKDEPGKGFFKFRVPVRRAGKEDLASQLSGLNENQLKIVAVMTKPSMHVDDIIDLSAMPASLVLSELTMLQIKGFVSQETGKRFTLNITK